MVENRRRGREDSNSRNDCDRHWFEIKGEGGRGRGQGEVKVLGERSKECKITSSSTNNA